MKIQTAEYLIKHFRCPKCEKQMELAEYKSKPVKELPGDIIVGEELTGTLVCVPCLMNISIWIYADTR